MIAPISKPLAWLVVLRWCAVSSTGWLTVAARASAASRCTSGSPRRPWSGRCSADWAPSLAWLELELRVSLPEASEAAAWLVSAAPSGELTGRGVDVAAPEATSAAPVARLRALVLSRPVAPSSGAGATGQRAFAAARAAGAGGHGAFARATPPVPRARTRAAPTATAGPGPGRARSEAQNSAEPPACRHRPLSCASSSARFPVAGGEPVGTVGDAWPRRASDWRVRSA